MHPRRQRRGRPRAAPGGGTVEINELAQHLQELMRSANMSVSRLCASFTEDQFRSDPDTPAIIPSRATVSRRLNGVGLLGQRMLVEAIVAACTTPETRSAAQQRAMRLFRRASQGATPTDATSGRQDELTKLRAQVAHLRQRLSTKSVESDALNAEILKLAQLVTRQGRTPGPADDSPDPRAAAFMQVLQRSEDARRRAERLAESRQRQLEELRKLLPAVDQVTPPVVAARPAEPTSAAEGFEKLVARIRDLDPTGTRFAGVLRKAFDTQLDGVHTGRFRWDQLSKVEKTTIGDRVRVLLKREFSFGDGNTMDFEIDGIEFDCRFSLTKEWMIPPEARSKPCLLITASDVRSEWSAGLLQITDDVLSAVPNRDMKRRITKEGRDSIRWIHENAPLPPNVLLQLPGDQVEAILSRRGASARVSELFRRAQGMVLNETTLQTVTLAENFGKRVREVVPVVRRDGVIVLSAHTAKIAQELGLPVPERGQWVSVRVVPAADDDVLVTTIDGQRWRPAHPEDPIVEAPQV